jgi:hypothetical protein|tara:strand:+ start:3976 stop:4296 length:321 start_codon:yes stop_codon:yes gene_type:complete
MSSLEERNAKKLRYKSINEKLRELYGTEGPCVADLQYQIEELEAKLKELELVIADQQSILDELCPKPTVEFQAILDSIDIALYSKKAIQCCNLAMRKQIAKTEGIK